MSARVHRVCPHLPPRVKRDHADELISARVRDTVLVTERDDGADVVRDRAAIEAIVGHGMAGEWPAGAMPPGTRVRVIKSEEWDGPWRQVFTRTIDETISPRLVGPGARPGELETSARGAVGWDLCDPIGAFAHRSAGRSDR